MKERICKWYPVCPMKRYHEKGQLKEKWIRDYCFKNGANCVRYEMEETGTYHPDTMLPDGRIDSELNN